MRQATPEDAKRVADALTAEGKKPGARVIANALNASGQFEPVARSTVHRWLKSGWTITQDAAKKADPEAVIPAMATGDPAATMATLRKALADLVGEGELTRLLRAPADDLLSELERLNLVTMIAAEHVAQAQAALTPAKDLGAFGRAIAQVLLTTANAAKARQAIAPPPQPGDNAKVIDHDDLDPMWTATRRKLAELAA